MNTGIIASRYATALLKLVNQTGGGETVVHQVEAFQNALDSLPDLRLAIGDEAAVSSEKKLSLFEAVLDEEPLAPELKRFLSLLMKNERIRDCRFVFNSFISDYYRSQGIRHGRLIMAAHSPSLEKTLDKLVKDNTGWNLRLETVVNPDLIGGFIFEIEDYQMDASVADQLETIRRQFVERNRRIV